MSAVPRASCVWAIAALFLVCGCEDKRLPSAPADLTSGITLYEHANYGGASALLTSDVADLKDFTGPCQHESSSGQYPSTYYYDWNDCASSIRVAPGWRATIYRDDNYRGQSLDITADVPNLQLVPGTCDHDGLNDCITSVRVRKQ